MESGAKRGSAKNERLKKRWQINVGGERLSEMRYLLARRWISQSCQLVCRRDSAVIKTTLIPSPEFN